MFNEWFWKKQNYFISLKKKRLKSFEEYTIKRVLCIGYFKSDWTPFIKSQFEILV